MTTTPIKDSQPSAIFPEPSEPNIWVTVGIAVAEIFMVIGLVAALIIASTHSLHGQASSKGIKYLAYIGIPIVLVMMMGGGAFIAEDTKA